MNVKELWIQVHGVQGVILDGLAVHPGQIDQFLLMLRNQNPVVTLNPPLLGVVLSVLAGIRLVFKRRNHIRFGLGFQHL